MSSLVREFQHDLVRSSKSTTELLRTAKLISVKLGLEDVAEWIEAELNGYADGNLIPEYRSLGGGELQVFNPYRGWQAAGQLGRRFSIGQPICEVEELIKGATVVVSLSHSEKYPVRTDTGVDMSNFQQQIEFSAVQLHGVVNAVRDKLLDWSLELEKRGILGENMSFDEREKKSAHSQTFHIQNFTGVFGDVSHSNVQIYDYSSLHQTLKQQNVPQQQRNELENIMDELKTAEPAKKAGLLEKAKDWVVKNQEFLGASTSIVSKRSAESLYA